MRASGVSLTDSLPVAWLEGRARLYSANPPASTSIGSTGREAQPDGSWAKKEARRGRPPGLRRSSRQAARDVSRLPSAEVQLLAVAGGCVFVAGVERRFGLEVIHAEAHLLHRPQFFALEVCKRPVILRPAQ